MIDQLSYMIMVFCNDSIVKSGKSLFVLAVEICRLFQSHLKYLIVFLGKETRYH